MMHTLWRPERASARPSPAVIVDLPSPEPALVTMIVRVPRWTCSCTVAASESKYDSETRSPGFRNATFLRSAFAAPFATGVRSVFGAPFAVACGAPFAVAWEDPFTVACAAPFTVACAAPFTVACAAPFDCGFGTGLESAFDCIRPPGSCALRSIVVRSRRHPETPARCSLFLGRPPRDHPHHGQLQLTCDVLG